MEKVEELIAEAQETGGSRVVALTHHSRTFAGQADAVWPTVQQGAVNLSYRLSCSPTVNS